MTKPERLMNPYGLPIDIATAKRIAAAATAEAGRQGWLMAIAIADPNGDLVYFEKMDATQIGSIQVAIAKARSAAMYKRSTKVFENSLAAGGENLRVLGLEDAVPVEGGLPLLSDGKIIGAIGVSGGLAHEDGVVALAGAAQLAE
jgi:uncharacterized protein GlcG (DUF336 family)